jgi:hypothetical protein
MRDAHLAKLAFILLNQPSLRLPLDPLQRVCLLFKSEDRIDIVRAPW